VVTASYVDKEGPAHRIVPSPIGGFRKRMIDIFIAAIALLLLMPIAIMVAVAIKTTSRGPVFYSHERVGFGGRTFRCLKFRTMVVDADAVIQRYLAENESAREEWNLYRKLRPDPRVTWIGRALRMSSLDEIPQLVNVLLGHMSCVGPRPVTLDELDRYGTNVSDYLAARPGITGAWQISGRNNLTFSDRVRLDADYVLDWSLTRDFGILLRTIPATLRFGETG
jgi:exopolysaccharide production protein ExoY